LSAPLVDILVEELHRVLRVMQANLVTQLQATAVLHAPAVRAGNSATRVHWTAPIALRENTAHLH
jgi:hypothetical protein